MKNVMVLVLFISLFAGCSFLERIAPSQVDEAGNPIPGTHEVIKPIADVTDHIPYADVGIGIFLLVWNGVERYRRKKTESGLVATVKAINAVIKDPETKTDVEKLKAELEKAHDVANVLPLIKSILAKV